MSTDATRTAWDPILRKLVANFQATARGLGELSGAPMDPSSVQAAIRYLTEQLPPSGGPRHLVWTLLSWHNLSLKDVGNSMPPNWMQEMNLEGPRMQHARCDNVQYRPRQADSGHIFGQRDASSSLSHTGVSPQPHPAQAAAKFSSGQAGLPHAATGSSAAQPAKSKLSPKRSLVGGYTKKPISSEKTLRRPPTLKKATISLTKTSRQHPLLKVANSPSRMKAVATKRPKIKSSYLPRRL